jgi:tRNA-Thr(GGU) m(6)t(6)A37 methyltransferase TsaA
MQNMELRPIGVLHCDLHRRAETPKSSSESTAQGVIEIYPQYLDGLDGVETGASIMVLFWFDRAARDVLRVHPRGDQARPRRGVFATRSPMRPNPIAVSRLKVLRRDGNRLTVQGLDAMDNTPVLDIKSY